MDLFLLVGFVLGEIYHSLTWKGVIMYAIFWVIIAGIWHFWFAM